MWMTGAALGMGDLVNAQQQRKEAFEQIHSRVTPAEMDRKAFEQIHTRVTPAEMEQIHAGNRAALNAVAGGEIQTLLEEINARLCRLAEVSDVLERRVAAVLSPECPVECVQSNVLGIVVTSEVGMKLDQIREFLALLIRQQEGRVERVRL